MSLDNALWHYAAAVYSQAEVESICLRLQLHYGLSINRVLWALWLATQGRRLAVALLYDQQLLQWNTEILSPLRALRYRLRNSGGKTPPRQSCYRSLQQAELEAEKVELARLYELGVGLHSPASGNARALATENLYGYLQAEEVAQHAELDRLIQRLIALSIPVTPETVLGDD